MLLTEMTIAKNFFVFVVDMLRIICCAKRNVFPIFNKSIIVRFDRGVSTRHRHEEQKAF